MENIGDNIAPDRKAAIQRYLNKCGCNPAKIGYNILVDVVSLAMDYPAENRQQLFRRYSEATGNERIVSWWLTAYNDARYCYITAESPNCKYQGVYRFIRSVALSVAEEENFEKAES